MWIYIVSLTISTVVTGLILNILIPKFKKREVKENTFASINKTVYPDKLIKRWFIFSGFFCTVASLILLFVPQLCEIIGFNWLITNVIWSSILFFDWICALIVFQVSHIEYTEDFMLITNMFHKTQKVYYSEIIRVKANLIIFTKTRNYYIPCSFFYGGKDFKFFILEKLIDVKGI